jgi:signal recognition particle GTPase
VVDTPALDPADAEALAALGGLLAAVEPDEIHLLLPASLGAGEATALVETVAPVLGVDRLLLTHLDAPTAGATGVAASLRTRLPISFTATGRAWGLRPADPCELARLVLP